MTRLTLRKNNMLDSLFSDAFNDFFVEGVKIRPYMNSVRRNAQVYNGDEDWQVVFAVPGVKKDAVDVKVDDYTLTVAYENKAEDNRFNFVSSLDNSSVCVIESKE